MKRPGFPKRLPSALLFSSVADSSIVLFCMALFCMALSRPAQAYESLLLTPRAGMDLGAALSVIQASFPAARVTPVFTDSEARALGSLGEERLAASVKISVATTEEKRTLSLFGTARGIPLEDNAEPAVMDSGESALERMQWGLRNRGLPQKLVVAEFKSLLIPGQAGEDMGSARFRELRSLRAGDSSAGGSANSSANSSNDARAPVIVAVLDTGIDAGHPDLSGKILRKDSECRALEEYRSCKKGKDPASCDQRFARIDTDGNGYPMDCEGWNVTGAKDPLTGILGDANTSDELGHGTHVAGIIAAERPGGGGMKGVAAHAGATLVRVLPVKVIKRSPNAPIRPQQQDEVPSPAEGSLRAGGTFADLLARGVLYAIRSGAQVINLSLAWPRAADSELMRRMTRLAQSRGILVVAAAGNDSTQAQVMPCAYAGVVCVAAHGPDGALSHFSNFGAASDIAAPGMGILSAWPLRRQPVTLTGHQGYDLKNGTSMASPFVAGALAALIEAGVPPREAVSRLYASAREHLAPEWENPGLPVKFTQHGNADLGGALALEPRPLLERTEKLPLQLELSGEGDARRITFAFELANRWKPASDQVTIQARIVPWESTQEATARLPSLETSQWQLSALGTGKIEGTLRLPHGGATESRFLIELEARATGFAQRLRVPVELSRKIDWALASLADRMSRPLSMRLSPRLSDDTQLRTVTAKDGRSGLEFLALRAASGKTEISLVSEQGDSFSVSPPIGLDGLTGELYSIQRLPLGIGAMGTGAMGAPGASEYALIFRLPPTAGSTLPSFRFLFLTNAANPSGELRVSRDFVHDNKVSAIPDRFQWMRSAQGPGAATLVPTWIGIGTTPALEKKPFDPWNPKPVDEPSRRLYYLASDGLRSIETGDQEFWIELLASPEAGDVRALVGRGDDYRIRYSVSRIENGARISDDKLELARFRMLEGIYQSAPVLTLSGERSNGTAFSGSGTPGTLRTTVLPGDGRGSSDVYQRSLSRLDSVMRTVGVFDSGSGISTFSETHYSLQYEDHATGHATLTSLGRFSFLPTFIFSQNFFPVIASRPSERGSERVPSVLIPAELGGPDGMEIVLPVAAKDGQPGLSRPAALKLQASGGCQWIGNPAPATPAQPSSVLFLCGGERIVSVPLDLANLGSF